MKIPNDSMWVQTNQGDRLGVLADTKNISLDSPTKLMLTRKAFALMDSVTDADFAYPVSIVYFDDSYVIVTTDDIFQGGMNGNTYTTVASSPITTLASDAIVCYGYMYVTTANNLSRWSGSSWNNSLASLTSGVPHPMCVFDSNPTYKLAIGNGNGVNLYDSSHNLSATNLTLPDDFQVTTIRYRNGYLYVGTKNINGGEARVFIWNGSGSNAQYECPVGAEWIFSMTEYSSSVAVITSQGQLLHINGSTFTELANLPVYYVPHARWQGNSGLALNGKVFNRGMVTIGDTIYLNIEGETDTIFIPQMKSGIWVYDKDAGLYHRASTSNARQISQLVLSVSDNTLTTATHYLKTGDAVMFTSVTGLSGVETGYVYYVDVVSATTFKLCLSREAIKSEDYVTVTSTGSILAAVETAYNTDYSSYYNSTSGAIARTVYNETPLEHWSSEIIWGARTTDVDDTAVYVLNAFVDAYNVGIFETQRIYATEKEQSWKQVLAFVDGLVLDDEAIVVKAKTTSTKNTINVSGTWLDANTINSDIALEKSALANVEEGDEVVIIDGYGRGRTCHVTHVSESTNVVSLTVDESLGTAGGELTFYVTKYRKLSTGTSDLKENGVLKYSTLENKTPWVSLKFELRGFDISVNVTELSNIIHSTAV